MKAKLIEELKSEGIRDERVLAALQKVPREKFVPPELIDFAYENQALPISRGQTISQPFVVARMTEFLLSLGETNRVLEIGTGSGYQAAILAQVFKKVYSIERIEELAKLAEQRFKEMDYQNIRVRYSDGFGGWPEFSPYDAIIGTAAATEIPEVLLEQLSPQNGRLIMPIGNQSFPSQQLVFIIRNDQTFEKIMADAVMFVPMQHGTA